MSPGSGRTAASGRCLRQLTSLGKAQTRLCLYGLENQTKVDTDIPLRVISYDGAGYRAQLLAEQRLVQA